MGLTRTDVVVVVLAAPPETLRGGRGEAKRMDEFFQFFQSFTFVLFIFSQISFLTLFGGFMEHLALKIIDGDFHIIHIMLLVTMPLGLLLMAATVIGAPLYFMWLLYNLPHIIYCFGRITNPDYPECSGRSHPPHLPVKNQDDVLKADLDLTNSASTDSSFDTGADQH